MLKKYFVGVVIALAAVLTYLQAAAVSHLLGGAILAGASPPPDRIMLTGLSVPEREIPGKQPILERNPFDSVTGPLTAQPPPNLELQAPKAPVIDDPLAVPGCDGVVVQIVTESTDPLWSVAAIKGSADPHPIMRRVGDDVGGQKVAFIGFNPREGSPAVWFESSGSLCQALLFSQPGAVGAAKSVPEQPSSAEAEPKPTRGGPSKVPDDIKNKIQKVSDSEFNVDRSVVDKILENQAELMRSARIVPEQKDGKVVGVRLFGIRPDTLLGTLGLQNGDRLESINGFDMGSPEKALEAYARLRTANGLKVQVNRRGKPMTIDFNIK